MAPRGAVPAPGPPGERRSRGSDLRLWTSRSTAPSALPEAPQFDLLVHRSSKGQPSPSRPSPPPLCPFIRRPKPAAWAGRRSQLLDPEEAPSPASAMEPTAPSLTEEDLTEVKKDVSSTTLSRRRRGLGAGGGGLQFCGRGKRKPSVLVRVGIAGGVRSRRSGTSTNRRTATSPAGEETWWK